MKRLIINFALLTPYLFVIFYLIIGFITPGYSHMEHTISRLSLGKYGYLETLNIIQFSFGILIMIYRVRHYIKNSLSVKEISSILSLSAVVLALLAIFPTDPIDSFPKSIVILSGNSIVHFILVISFVLYAPVAIVRLYRTFCQDKNYSNLSIFTVACGGTAFILSLIWFIFFYVGFLNEYRGLFQKVIGLIAIFWLSKIMRRIDSTSQLL